MRKVLASLAAAALLAFGFAAKPVIASADEKVVTIHLQGDSVSQSALARVAFAIQMQMSRDFYPAWKIVVRIVLDNDAEATAMTTYQVYVTTWPAFHKLHPEVEWSLCFCYGFHSYWADSKTPVAYIFTDLADDMQGIHSWSLVVSHEILEMLVDPYLDQRGLDSEPIELSDDVHSESYVIGDVQVADFLYPSYFNGSKDGPYDFLNKMDHKYVPTWYDRIEHRGGIR